MSRELKETTGGMLWDIGFGLIAPEYVGCAAKPPSVEGADQETNDAWHTLLGKTQDWDQLQPFTTNTKQQFPHARFSSGTLSYVDAKQRFSRRFADEMSTSKPNDELALELALAAGGYVLSKILYPAVGSQHDRNRPGRRRPGTS